jgi:hypothetical protein
MANTVTNTRINLGDKRVIQYICIDSDGTEETDLVVYDSSAVAAAFTPARVDSLNCRINSIKSISNSALGVVKLEFDATTDVLALALPYGGSDVEMDFRCFGGLKNTAGDGKTGDITLTTTGLVSGDSVIIILDIDPSF